MNIFFHIVDFSSIFFMINWSVKFVMNYNSIYRTLSPDIKIQFDNRIVSTAHSLIAPIHAITSIYKYGWTPYSTLKELPKEISYKLYFSTAYFLWDVFASLQEKDKSFVLHAFACLLVFMMGCWNPTISSFIVSFLFYELSTPFVNIRWFLLTFNPIKFKKYIKQLEKIIFVLFALTRIGIGLPLQYNILDTYWSSFKNNPTLMKMGALSANISLGGLNIYWFGKMLKKFLKK